MKKDLRNMFRWSLRRAFSEHPEETISLNTVKFLVEDVWKDMVKYGEIGEMDENNERKWHQEAERMKEAYEKRKQL